MTWIKTVSVSEDDEVRKAVESQRELYPIEYATPVHPTADGETAGIVAFADSQGALSRVRDVWFVDVAGSTFDPAPARDDHDCGLGDQPVSLLNRIARRVSASSDTGSGSRSCFGRRLSLRAHHGAGAHHARLRGADNAGRNAHLTRGSRAFAFRRVR